MYVDVAYCYRPSSVVCRSVGLSVGLSVCHTREPCKNGSTNRDAVWVGDSDGTKEPCIRWGPDPPMGRGNFEGRKGRPIVKYRGHYVVICAKTAEPIEMPFGLWAWINPRNHLLDGGPAVLRDVAMATNFGTQFAITGFVLKIATRQLVMEVG